VAGGALVVGVSIVAAWGTGYHFADVPVAAAAAAEPAVIPAASAEVPAEVRRLRQRRRQLENRLARTEPRGRYIVIDQTHNRLYLKEDDRTLLEADCSAGSGLVLKESEGGRGRTWVFDTPRGRFRVLSKITNPVWRKPDWAFVEEGVPIPRNPADRLEYGTLGEYALYFGDGFMIHGTLYERLLGRSVSHGCIRLGRDDLRQLYRAARVGTPIYIY
jgi:L,D-transpeptidase YbiS